MTLAFLKTDEGLTYLKSLLPHGSGIDYAWTFDIHSKSIVCSNGFHLMDDKGMYRTTQAFFISNNRDKENNRTICCDRYLLSDTDSRRHRLFVPFFR